MVTQLCFRSREVFSQGITRISKSQRSFCRERRRGEYGPRNAIFSLRRCTLGCESSSHGLKGTKSRMARASSQILLAHSREGETPVSSSLHPTLAWRLSHPEGRDRFSQTSAWPSRPVQAGQPRALGAGQWGAITSSCTPVARGQAVIFTPSPAAMFFRQAVLPISMVR